MFSIAIRDSMSVGGQLLIMFGLEVNIDKSLKVSPLAPLLKIDGVVVNTLKYELNRITVDKGYLWWFYTPNEFFKILKNAKTIEMDCIVFLNDEAHLKMNVEYLRSIIDIQLNFLEWRR